MKREERVPTSAQLSLPSHSQHLTASIVFVGILHSYCDCTSLLCPLFSRALPHRRMGDAFNWAAVHASRLPQFVNPVDHICFACGGRGHFSQDCIEASDGTTSAASHQAIIHPSRLAQIEDDIANSICSACGGLGHLSEDCTLPNGPDPGPIPPGKGANAEPLGGNAKRRHVSQPTKEPHKRQKQQQPRRSPLQPSTRRMDKPCLLQAAFGNHGSRMSQCSSSTKSLWEAVKSSLPQVHRFDRHTAT